MIANMRERVKFQTESDVADGGGGFTATWINHVTVWGKVSPVKIDEEAQADQLQAEVLYKIKIRYRSDLSEKMRIVWQGKNLNIRSITNPDERKRYNEIIAEQGVAI
ncbi:MAG: phage head closure protein [Rickettsiales bacterium]|nr:phage head closure protein [Pseudomonadota bacterium]MDA0966881.1 phage head closure protein [Pseudomonadota bacterium]MDG4543556.1 phage head closure protein [Rickettsiales bacterium]MDG4545704.1 phage head closure protein [Rickettsiales bacterium]MDG4547523.1 phage head closure protein [Rickettsiales bacterium]